jgi:hypothetical protein
METIKVLLDAKLLKAADLRERELQEQERRAYLAKPQREDEYRVWESIATWPER